MAVLIECSADPAVVWRLKIHVRAGRAVLASDDWCDAVEAALRVVERGGELAARHRSVIDEAIARDSAHGPGLMASDLTELLALVEKRRRGHAVAPPPRTKEQLLAVPCPTCEAMVGEYCEELRPGKVLPLPQHHAERFWAAVTTKATENLD